MLEFQNVSFQYKGDEWPMFHNLSFDVQKGDFISIVGASGCGKSTVFRLINGIEKMQEGKIFVNDTEISELSNYCAFMPQKDLLFPWRTVGANVALPLEIQKVPKKERQKRVREMLTLVGLSDYENKYPRELSGGMRQRVSFVRTLLTGSDLLLLDEPFSALDSLTKLSLQEWLLEQWVRFHKTVIFVTHDVEEAIFLSQKIFVMKDRPVSSIEEVAIPLDYPREHSFLSDPEMVRLKEELIQSLRES